jgi:arylsulfatase A-like enzyme
MLGDHGLVLKGCRFYEGAVHVPLIICWPEHVRKGLRSSALVELADLVPTLLEAIGLPVPDEVQGRSLMPILRGDSDPSLHHEFVRCEYHDALDRPYASHANMLYDGRHKLVVYHGHAMGELYDLEHDPSEFENLWDQPSAASLKAHLTRTLFDAVMLSTDPGQPRIGRY